MNSERRIEIYTRGLNHKTADGIYRFTPAQRRRFNKKYFRDLLESAARLELMADLAKESASE